MSYIGLGTEPTSELPAATKALAEGVALRVDPTKGKKYKVALATALWSAQRLDQSVEDFAKSQAGQITLAAGNAAGVAYEIARNIGQGKYKADAGGVVDIARDVFSMTDAVVGLLAKANVSPQVLNEVAGWTSVGTTCAASVATLGPLAGGVACGLGALAKLLSYIGGKPSYGAATTTPRTVFVPNRASMDHISADALRLAQVLRHHYRVATFTSLKSQLDLAEGTFQWIASTDLYPSRPAVFEGEVVAKSDRPIPGHNLRTILQMASFNQMGNPLAALSNTRDALAFIAAWRHQAFGEPAGRALYERYDWDHDISQRVIATGAWIGRSAALTNGTTKAEVHIPHVVNIKSWPGRTTAKSFTRVVDFYPFVVVDELINFFAAVTKREIDDPVLRAAFNENYQIGEMNPTRHMWVRDSSDRSGVPPANGAAEYSAKCWTNEARAVETCSELRWRLTNAPDIECLREAAAVRLMAAFSFLHQQWAWSTDPLTMQRQDPIARIAPIDASDPAAELRLPVDPRQLVRAGSTFVPHPMRPGLEFTHEWRQISRVVQSSIDAIAVAMPVGGGRFNVSSVYNSALGYGPAATDAGYLGAQIAKRELIVQETLQVMSQQSLPSVEQLDAIRRTEEAWSATFGRPLTSYELAEIRRKIYGIEVQTTRVLPQDVYKLAQKIIGQTASTLALKDPMRKLDLRLERPGIGVGGAVLLGAAALLALKFLK